MISSSLFSALLAALAALAVTNAQIPTACADQNSLETSTCCPMTADGICGEDANRGSCMTLNFPDYDNSTDNVRENWPHYYTQICHCNGNFGGYDCNRCKFGYYGSDCSRFQVLPRPPARDLSDEDWADFTSILRMSKVYPSGYSAVLEESPPGNGSVPSTPLSIYNFYVWIHHYTTKDTFDPVNPLDYAHGGPAFLTWHRMLHLNLEWQLQGMLLDMGRDNYQDFRLPYWDWRPEFQLSPEGLSAEELFTEERLGATKNVSGFPHVVGVIYDDNWYSVCWLRLGQLCDPRENTGPIQRCPFTERDPDPCRSTNPEWPTNQDVLDTLKFDVFDVPNYDLKSMGGFRNFIDVNASFDVESCRENRMCECIPGGPLCDAVNGSTPIVAIAWKTHGRPHFITGLGDLHTGLELPPEKTGQMGDFGGPPNDPFFIVHHTMVDCIFIKWLAAHPDTEFPTEARYGHRRDDYSNSFFPLYTNEELFGPAEQFGYSCSLADIPGAEIPGAGVAFAACPMMLLASLVAAFVAVNNLANQ